MDNKIIVSRIKFNERVAVVTVTDSSCDKKRIVAKVMRKISTQEKKNNKPIMYVEMNENDAQALFSTEHLEVVKA